MSIEIFYFDGHRLVEKARVEEGDLLDAIEQAQRDAAGRRVEVWNGQGRMAEFGERVPRDPDVVL